MQQYADIYLLLNYSTCFGRPSRPSSELHKTIVAASGTDHAIWGPGFLKRDKILVSPYLVTFEEACSQYSYDLYQRLQLEFYVLLMTGAMGARNM